MQSPAAPILQARLHRSFASLRMTKFWRDSSLSYGSLYFTQFSRLHVVNKAAHRDVLWNPGMRFHALHLETYVLFQVIEGVEVLGLVRAGSHLFSEARFQFIFADFEQAAIGVVDDDEFLRVEQMMGDDERAEGVVCGDAAGVADHVGVPGMQAEAVLEEDAGIHAGQHGDVALGADSEISQGEIASEGFVSF